VYTNPTHTVAQSTAVTSLVLTQQKCAFKVWDTFTQNVKSGVLKYSKNVDWRSGECLTLGGVGKFVPTMQTWATPQEHASLPTDVITTASAILKEKMKKEMHGCEP